MGLSSPFKVDNDFLLFGAGAVLWIVVFSCAFVILRKSATPTDPKLSIAPFVSASVGGGNRGALLLLLFSGFVLPIWPWLGSGNDLIKNFALMDLGYFFALLIIGQTIMQVRFSSESSGGGHENLEGGSRSFFRSLNRVLRYFLRVLPYFLRRLGEQNGFIVAMTAGYILNSLNKDGPSGQSMLSFLSDIKIYSGFVLAFFTAFSAFYGAGGQNTVKIYRIIFHSRLASLVVAGFLFAILGFVLSRFLSLLDGEIWDLYWIIVSISVLFAVLPPSSLVHELLRDSGASVEQTSIASSVVAHTSVVFAIVLIIVMFIVFIPSMSF